MEGREITGRVPDNRDVHMVCGDDPYAADGYSVPDDAVWLRWRAVYASPDVPDLVLEGEERAWLEGDRIARLEDHFSEASAKAASEHLARHGSDLR